MLRYETYPGQPTQYQKVVKPPKRIRITSTLNDFQRLFTTGINLCPDHKWGTIAWSDYLSSKLTKH